MSRPPAAAAIIAPTTFASWNGSRASGSARLTSGMTAIASPRRTTPRTPASFSTARTRGLRPEAVAIVPSCRRTAAAQCVGPWTSRPLRSAMPPRRSFSATEQVLAHVAEERRREAEVAHVDALVGRVDERPRLVEAHVTVREEAVGDAVGERVAERPRVGESRQDRGKDGGAGVLLADPALDRVHERRADGRLVSWDALGELQPVAVLADDLADARERVLLPETRRDPAVDAQLGAGGDDVDLLRCRDSRR